jgi:hypothetical protein
VFLEKKILVTGEQVQVKKGKLKYKQSGAAQVSGLNVSQFGVTMGHQHFRWMQANQGLPVS